MWTRGRWGWAGGVGARGSGPSSCGGVDAADDSWLTVQPSDVPRHARSAGGPTGERAERNVVEWVVLLLLEEVKGRGGQGWRVGAEGELV